MFEEIIAFAQEHCQDDPLKLALQQRRYPSIDLGLVAQQLEGRRQALAKWPSLVSCQQYFFPPKINREQSSSETTAKYKADLFRQLNGRTFADLTGGMGIDTYFIGREAECADYFELNTNLFGITEHNLAVLQQTQIHCHNTDSIQHLTEHNTTYDLILIDPARRNDHGAKVVAFEDCTPNLLDNLAMIRSRCRYLMVKASPMIDLRQAMQQLGSVNAVHIISVNGECKEVLFLIPGNQTSHATQTHCVNLESTDCAISFSPEQESLIPPLFASAMGLYIYEPNASIMKGGCYNILGQQFAIAQLARNTHLYTSDTWVENFPGRKFRVLQEIALNAKEAKKALPEGKAHVATRNYPMAAADLQKKLKLKEGGNLFIIAATLGSKPLGWLCEKC